MPQDFLRIEKPVSEIIQSFREKKKKLKKILESRHIDPRISGEFATTNIHIDA